MARFVSGVELTARIPGNVAQEPLGASAPAWATSGPPGRLLRLVAARFACLILTTVTSRTRRAT